MLKFYLRNFFIPPLIYNFLGSLKYKLFSKKSKYTSQLPYNWKGQDIIIRLVKKSINSKKSFIKTIDHESKVVHEIDLNKKYIFNKDINKDSISFSIFISKNYEQIKDVQVFLNDIKVKMIFDNLVPNKWLYINSEIPKSSQKNVSIKIIATGANSILVSEPFFYNKKLNNIQAKRNNIIVIVLDGLRPNFIGSYNQKKKNNTPYIDKFFKDGVIFKNAFSQSEYTMPSIASMFSGLYPIQHGVFTHDKSQRELPHNIELVTEYLYKNNYRTMVYSNTLRFIPQYGYYRGVERFFHHNLTDLNLDSFTITNKAIEFAETHKNENFFMFLHYMDTHPPFSLPTYFYDSNSNTDYYHNTSKIYNKLKMHADKSDKFISSIENTADSKLKNTDFILGNLFAYINNSDLNKNTSVILLADHGRQYKKSEPLLLKNLTQVPYMIKYPGSKRDIKDFYCETNSSLYPTIMDLASLNKPEHLAGKSVFEKSQNNYALSESLFKKNAETSIRNNDYVYIQKTDFDYMKGKLNLENVNKEYLFTENEFETNNGENLIDKEEKIKENLKEKILNHYKTQKKYFDNNQILEATKNYKE